jgi:ubiquinone/menaquinone biosynthesis C-methylase UbiE
MQLDDIPRNRLYGDLAWLWPYLSFPEDYAEEASHWRGVLCEKLGEGRHHILELGVGGGNNLSHLTGDFDATAVDLSDGMLEHSKKLNPSVEHHIGDMRMVRLGRTFDAVIIHDAISYLTSEEDIRRTLETVSAHLDKGGTFVTSPDYFVETFRSPEVSMQTKSKDGVELVFTEYGYRVSDHSPLVENIMTYYILRDGDLSIEYDRHTTGLFSLSTWQRLIEETGFSFEKRDYPVHDDKRQAYLMIGTKK